MASAEFEADYNRFRIPDLVERALGRYFSGKNDAANIEPRLVKAEADMIWGRVNQILPQDWASIGHTNNGLYNTLRYNVYLSRVFKHHQMARELVGFLQDPSTGTARSWASFERMARPVVGNYSKAWLRTEYNLAVGQSQMVDRWHSKLKKHKMLRFVAVQDERTRDSHKLLHGITLPSDDPFWRSHYPLLDYGCRCLVIPAPDNAPIVRPTQLPPVPAAFQDHPAFSGEIFPTDSSPYFRVLPENRQTVQNLFGYLEKMPVSPQELTRRKVFATEYLSKPGYKVVPRPAGQEDYQGLLIAQDGQQEGDLRDTVPVGHDAAALGNVVVLLASGNDRKYADALMNGDGLAWEFKNTSGNENSLGKHVSDANKKAQGMWVKIPLEVSVNRILQSIRGKLLLKKEVRLEKVTVYNGRDLREESSQNLLK